MTKFTFYSKKKEFILNVKECKTIWSKFSGLMFRKTSPPLLFIFSKEKNLSIHSFFCKPFKAIWLDDNKQITQIVDVKKWKSSMSGRGKYLLEIPFTSSSSVNLFRR